MKNDADKKTMQQMLWKEMMDKYDYFRTCWINRNGDDTGYNEWFTAQIKSNTDYATKISFR